MTGQWCDPAPGILKGFATYAADAITGATPGMDLKAGESVSFLPLLLGNTSGTLGGTSAVLALAGGWYLLKTKTANYRIVAAAFTGFLVAQTALWVSGTGGGVDPLRAALAGNAVFGFLFYATDPVSACKTNEGRWLYGTFIGIMTCLISSFSAWPAGTMFAILLANMFASITDHAVRAWKKKRGRK
jgi:Na+-transporting NADH:ubiquinone oxidoreductase subunit B